MSDNTETSGRLQDKTRNERKKRERQKKRDMGLTPKEVWIVPEDTEELKEFERQSQKKVKGA